MGEREMFVWKVKYWQLHNTLLNMIIEGIQKETAKISSQKCSALVDSFYGILLTFFCSLFEVVCGMGKKGGKEKCSRNMK